MNWLMVAVLFSERNTNQYKNRVCVLKRKNKAFHPIALQENAKNYWERNVVHFRSVIMGSVLEKREWNNFMRNAFETTKTWN